MQLNVMAPLHGLKRLPPHFLGRRIAQVPPELACVPFEGPVLTDLEHDRQLRTVPVTNIQQPTRGQNHIPHDVPGTIAEDLIVECQKKMQQLRPSFRADDGPTGAGLRHDSYRGEPSDRVASRLPWSSPPR